MRRSPATGELQQDATVPTPTTTPTTIKRQVLRTPAITTPRLTSTPTLPIIATATEIPPAHHPAPLQLRQQALARRRPPEVARLDAHRTTRKLSQIWR